MSGGGCQGCAGECDQDAPETTQPDPNEDKWGDDCKDDCGDDCKGDGSCGTCSS